MFIFLNIYIKYDIFIQVFFFLGQAISSALAVQIITGEYSEMGGLVVLIEGDKKSLPSPSLEKNQLSNQHTALQ